MKREDAYSLISIPTWGFVSLINNALPYIFSQFYLDYSINDETAFIGKHSNPLKEAYESFFYFGRPLFGLNNSSVYRFSDYDPIKIQYVRYVNFALVAAIALLLCRFMWITSKNIYLSFSTILFYFSPPRLY
jgi:hypothetical protein